MKNKRKYHFRIGKRVLIFASNTCGGAFDKAIHWWKRFAPKQPRPTYFEPIT